MRLFEGLRWIFRRRNRGRLSKEGDGAAARADDEKVTRAMAKKIMDDARLHRLSVDREADGQREDYKP